MGHDVQPDGEGQRVIPHAISENVITEGKVAFRTTHATTHAGIVGVERFRFSLP